ncbi:MAG: hypothetical protein KC613_01575 [Myxococcales bacterium]|nr:hypothetical protein [Myxococcales bacterium]MCB9522020.1 hypothetical protein [Myxococcales bacterium]
MKGWLTIGLALSAAGCQTALLDGVDEATANEAVAILAAEGVPSSKTGRRGRWTVAVPSADGARAWRAVQAGGLPTDDSSRPGPTPWVRSPTEARALARRQVAQDLQAALSLRPDILRARVTLSEDGAAVVAQHPAGHAPPIAELQALVQRGAGLSAPDQVTVSLHPAVAAAAVLAPPDHRWTAGLAALALACLGWLARRRWRRTAP